MKLKLKIWRQRDPNTRGKFVNYMLNDISSDSSFLEMLDVLNEELISKGEEQVLYDHDCREGICGACGLYINGRPHGPDSLITVCQLHMRKFKDGDTIVIEPWRARAFPVIRDLMVDRNAFDKLIQEGGYVSVNTGSAPDANSIPVKKEYADLSMDAAACIGCGSCFAACKNASAMLFVGAKISLCFPRARWRPGNEPGIWWQRWTNWASGTAPIQEHARQNVPRESSSPILPG